MSRSPIERLLLLSIPVCWAITFAGACSERTTPAVAPQATSDPAVEASKPSQAAQQTPQGEVPADTPSKR